MAKILKFIRGKFSALFVLKHSIVSPLSFSAVILNFLTLLNQTRVFEKKILNNTNNLDNEKSCTLTRDFGSTASLDQVHSLITRESIYRDREFHVTYHITLITMLLIYRLKFALDFVYYYGFEF